MIRWIEYIILMRRLFWIVKTLFVIISILTVVYIWMTLLNVLIVLLSFNVIFIMCLLTLILSWLLDIDYFMTTEMLWVQLLLLSYLSFNRIYLLILQLYLFCCLYLLWFIYLCLWWFWYYAVTAGTYLFLSLLIRLLFSFISIRLLFIILSFILLLFICLLIFKGFLCLSSDLIFRVYYVLCIKNIILWSLKLSEWFRAILKRSVIVNIGNIMMFWNEFLK